MKITKWNTGRQYTVNGQRVAATMLPDGRIAFYDRDREIFGIVNPLLDDAIQFEVMSAYDAGAYSESGIDNATRDALRAAY